MNLRKPKSEGDKRLGPQIKLNPQAILLFCWFDSVKLNRARKMVGGSPIRKCNIYAVCQIKWRGMGRDSQCVRKSVLFTNNTGSSPHLPFCQTLIHGVLDCNNTVIPASLTVTLFTRRTRILSVVFKVALTSVIPNRFKPPQALW